MAGAEPRRARQELDGIDEARFGEKSLRYYAEVICTAIIPCLLSPTESPYVTSSAERGVLHH